MQKCLFGVAVMSMFISSLVAPPVLVKVFKGGSGFKKSLDVGDKHALKTISFEMPSISLADFVITRLLTAFRQADYFPRHIGHGKPVYAVQKDDVHITLLRDGITITANVPPSQETFVRLLLTEEILSLKELFRSVEKVAGSDEMERDMLAGLFGAGDD